MTEMQTIIAELRKVHQCYLEESDHRTPEENLLHMWAKRQIRAAEFLEELSKAFDLQSIIDEMQEALDRPNDWPLSDDDIGFWISKTKLSNIVDTLEKIQKEIGR